MAKFVKLKAEGYLTDLNPQGVYLIGNKRYNFANITVTQCQEIIATGSKHIKKRKQHTTPS